MRGHRARSGNACMYLKGGICMSSVLDPWTEYESSPEAKAESEAINFWYSDVLCNCSEREKEDGDWLPSWAAD